MKKREKNRKRKEKDDEKKGKQKRQRRQKEGPDIVCDGCQTRCGWLLVNDGRTDVRKD